MSSATPVPAAFDALPRAFGPVPASGTVKSRPEDFLVRERLGFAADGDGGHLLLTVRKRGANTHWVAGELARRAGVSPRDVGYAGIKDRHAVTEQSFTVPAQGGTVGDWIGCSGDGWEVIAAGLHRRKLKRGAHQGNEFRIVVRDVKADADLLAARLANIGVAGAPNWFGPQRFGRDGRNLDVAARWFAGARAPADRLQRGFALSAARSALFNEVLAARIRAGTWDRLIDGDVANLDGSGSHFVVEAVDAALAARCAMLDLHPTGPLPGRGDPRVTAAAAAFEQDVLAPWSSWLQGLADAGTEAQRRPLRVAVHDLTWSRDDDVLELSFRLGRGAYATAVLAEIIGPGVAGALEEGGE